jgi:hypothetical protein
MTRDEAEATRDEAEAELEHRYRIRVMVELGHEGVIGAMKGSTMAETAAGVEHALRGLVEVMCPRLLASVDEQQRTREEALHGESTTPGEGPQGAAGVQGGDAPLGLRRHGEE